MSCFTWDLKQGPLSYKLCMLNGKSCDRFLIVLFSVDQVELSSSVQHLKAALDVMDTQMKQRQLLESISQTELDQLRQETQDLAAISDERSKIRKMQLNFSVIL